MRLAGLARGRSVFFLVLALPLAAPGAASGAVADADVERGRDGIHVRSVTFIAEKGERNRLTIAVDEATGDYVFHDAANRVKAKGGCVRQDRHTARCPTAGENVVAKLGDGDDWALVRTTQFGLVSGGRGNDVLLGSTGRQQLAGDRGADTLRGGADDDELTGGPGRDKLYGGSGNDLLIDGERDGQAARDVYRGGPSSPRGVGGGDLISYVDRGRPVRIDLARARNSTGDKLVSVESVIGGRGDDRLVGDRGPNQLNGFAGDDVIRGRGGRDILTGGLGSDHLAGGPGNDVIWAIGGRDRVAGGRGDDRIFALDGAVDTIACGPGRDEVRHDRRDRLRGCE